jgi:hypothetical protein
MTNYRKSGSENLKEFDHLEDLSLGGRPVLKYMFEKWV